MQYNLYQLIIIIFFTIIMCVCAGVECSDPGRPVNGRAVMSDFSLGSRVYAVCDDGFQTSDPVVLRCTTNGTWSVPMPTCTPTRAKAADSGKACVQS